VVQPCINTQQASMSSRSEIGIGSTPLILRMRCAPRVNLRRFVSWKASTETTMYTVSRDRSIAFRIDGVRRAEISEARTLMRRPVFPTGRTV
jgi:hypothetical protein